MTPPPTYGRCSPGPTAPWAPARPALFRLLGLHPGPDISRAAAASLAGVPLGQAGRLLAELARAHLLTEHAPGRYAFHDLLRAYAAERAHAQEDDDARRVAIHRMLDHYLHTAETAASRLNPVRDPVASMPPQPRVTCDDVADYRQAMAWFTAERPVLLSTVAQVPAGFGTYTWQLAAALTTFLDLRGHWQDQKAVQAAGLAAARRGGNQAGQAIACRGLGLAYAGLKQFGDARTHYLLALELFTELGDPTGQAQAHLNLAWLAGVQGQHDEGLHHSRQSLSHYQAAGRPAGQARALNNIGWHLAERGDFGQALGAMPAGPRHPPRTRRPQQPGAHQRQPRLYLPPPWPPRAGHRVLPGGADAFPRHRRLIRRGLLPQLPR